MKTLQQNGGVSNKTHSSINNYITNPSLTKYYLASIMPFQTISHPKQFIKNKQFYKPQQFIWNNPHRTSKRLYPYYHQFNDNYEKNIKPKLDKQIENDRVEKERDRIKTLSLIRIQTRRKFHSRQQMRMRLEAEADSRKRNITSNTQFKNYQDQDSHNAASNLFIQTKNSHFLKSQSDALKSRSKKKKNNQTSITEQSYYQGVDQWDKNVQKIKNIFTQQLINNHNKIRAQFKARKQLNQTLNKTGKKSRIFQATENNYRKTDQPNSNLI